MKRAYQKRYEEKKFIRLFDCLDENKNGTLGIDEFIEVRILTDLIY